jgi:hypothetical protein
VRCLPDDFFNFDEGIDLPMSGFPFGIFPSSELGDDEFWSFEFGRNNFGDDFCAGNGRFTDFHIVFFADGQNVGKFECISLLNSVSKIDSEPSIYFCFDLPTTVSDNCVHGYFVFLLRILAVSIELLQPPLILPENKRKTRGIRRLAGGAGE